MNHLKLIALENIKEIGEEVNVKLKDLNQTDENYLLKIAECRFSNGEGKVKIEETVRDKDIYILADVGNYGLTYQMHGFTHHMAPDEHFQDIKRTISALAGSAEKVSVIMPLLYQSRQHKRKGKESLDCAIALQELERLGVGHIITFDCHDPNVCNAIPNLPFENFYASNTILKNIEQKEQLNSLLVVSPDLGATERARYYAEILGCDVGIFYKRRDLSKVVNGKNPIAEHIYMGPEIKEKDVLVVDDMIASGGSMIEVGQKLKEKGANKIYFITTFSLFTEGVKDFDNAYENNYLDKIYTTNLTYIPEEIKQKEWLNVVDCSYDIAKIINALHNKESLKSVKEDYPKILNLKK